MGEARAMTRLLRTSWSAFMSAIDRSRVWSCQKRRSTRPPQIGFHSGTAFWLQGERFDALVPVPFSRPIARPSKIEQDVV